MFLAFQTLSMTTSAGRSHGQVWAMRRSEPTLQITGDSIGRVAQYSIDTDTHIRAGVVHIRGIAPQLLGKQRWYALARYIANKILTFVPHTPIPTAAATG